ncbi:MAG: D-glycero-beta-D-manno-heptose 1-phosphate adenylyltransferase [Candidatus Neomarinimicrobiota bacterium]|nr:MAG: D-glycero-beta-D-manno-heptose 1-phosphate adenylyltransferase [Candidatus Neomarinimicrobiota bacterium]
MILTPDQARNQIRDWQGAGDRVVFTNGCFDLLHPGHLALLEAARDLGDHLVVGVNSDTSVRRLKGPERPLIPEKDRARLLDGLKPVDLVVVFSELTPRSLIARLGPDILVKGGDYSPDQVVGRTEVEARGGRVVIVPLVPGYSTTALLQRLKNAGGNSLDTP